MTPDLAVNPETVAADGPSRRIDAVRARIAANSRYALADADWRPEPLPSRRGIHLLPDTRSPRPRGPHPGDILYWVACLGGACLLLFSATT